MSAALAVAERWLLHAITGQHVPKDRRRLGGARVPVEIGLGIYRNAYRSRLIDSLADDYPALQSLLGQESFSALAEAVITALPPTDATLNRFGRRLLGYLRRHPQATPHGRLALDLARLEWAIVEAIHAPLVPALDQAAFGAIPADGWPGVRLQPSPSLRLITSRWPIDVCYCQHLRGEPVTAPDPASEVVAVVRRPEGLERRRFTPAAGRLIIRLTRGRPLGEALTGCRLEPAAVGGVLRDATGFGCFSGVACQTA